MLRNHKKHVGSPCRWLPFLGNKLLPWSIRREEDISMEKRLHLESGRGIMEHFHTFSSFWNYFFNKRSCSGTYPFRPDKWLLPRFPSAHEPTLYPWLTLSTPAPLKQIRERDFPIFFCFKEGRGCLYTAFSCLRSFELFWLVCQLSSTLTSDEDSFNSRSLPDMSEFLFLLLRGGGCWFLEFDTRFSGRKKSLLCIFLICHP